MHTSGSGSLHVRDLPAESPNSEGLRNFIADLEGYFGSSAKRCLDIPAEEDLLAKGMAHGLSRINALRCMLLLSQKRGIAVERVLREMFSHRVEAAVGDRLLDEMERQELERQGGELFEQAENPAAITAAVLEKVRSKAGALSEAEVKDILLKNTKKGQSLTQERWDEIARQTIQELHSRAVSREENDLGELLEKAREEHGVFLREPANILVMILWMLGVATTVFLVGRFFLHL